MHLGIYRIDPVGGQSTLVLDASANNAYDVRVTYGDHGFETLTATIPLPFANAWQLYDYGEPLRVMLRYNAVILFDGRLSGATIIADEDGERLDIVAHGWWDAFEDILYTAFWSTTSTQGWRPILETEFSTSGGASPKRFSFDSNNRILVSPNKNEMFHWNLGGIMAYRLPDRGRRPATRLSFDYVSVFPTTSWVSVFWSWSSAPSNASWTLISSAIFQTGSGSGSATYTGSWAGAVSIGIVYNVAPPGAALTEDTGTQYLRATNIRLASATPPITLPMILADIIAAVHERNPNTFGDVIIEPGLTFPDITDAVYEDANPKDILNDLAAVGSSDGDALRIDVWENGRITIRKARTPRRTWYVDVSALSIRLPLDTVYNRVYARYQDGEGWRLRTTTAEDAMSVVRHRIRRERMVRAETTSLSEAERQRNMTLALNAAPRHTARIAIAALENEHGQRMPLWSILPGDILIIRAVPSPYGETTQIARTLRVRRVEYDADNDIALVEPEELSPTIETALAQR